MCGHCKWIQEHWSTHTVLNTFRRSQQDWNIIFLFEKREFIWYSIEWKWKKKPFFFLHFGCCCCCWCANASLPFLSCSFSMCCWIWVRFCQIFRTRACVHTHYILVHSVCVPFRSVSFRFVLFLHLWYDIYSNDCLLGRKAILSRVLNLCENKWRK